MATTKMKIAAEGGVAKVQVLIRHPQENGRRKDEAGDLIPAHFLKTMTISLNGAAVTNIDLTSGVSKNPLIGVNLTANAGDMVGVAWTDSKGESEAIEKAVP